MKSEVQEAVAIILGQKLKDAAFIAPRMQAAIDVMEVIPSYYHLTVLRAIFHVQPPTPEESGENDGT